VVSWRRYLARRHAGALEVPMRRALLAAGLLFVALPAFAATLAGVTLPDTITVGTRTLVLNGMGLRTKLFVKVYAAGLYLEKKSGDAEAVIQQDAAKRIVLEFIRGEVTREQMQEAFDDALKANVPDRGASLQRETARFLSALETMHQKEQMAITYVPGVGTTVTVRGKDKLTIPGLPFAQIVFSMWLGPRPPNGDLKAGLLGKK
jgi:hypothetical protein